MSKYRLSVLIPSRSEMFLSKTVEDILENSSDSTEIIIVCDGNWPDPPVKDHPRVTMIYHSESIGQRAATNEAAKLSRAKYVMKCDAHCSFAKGFDEIMLADMQDDVTMVPVMRNLHAFNWVCKNGHSRYQGPSGPCTECGEPTERDIVWIAKNNPQSTFYVYDEEPHFQYGKEFKGRDWYRKQKEESNLTETMSLQGSCWMLTRKRYFELDIDNDDFGSWGSQGIEVATKTWLGGGRVLVNHKTYYAHMFRTQGGDFGFPYSISGRQVQHAKKHAKELFFKNQWKGQKRNLSWLLDKFWPIPGWSESTLKEVRNNDLPHLEKWDKTPVITMTERKEEKVIQPQPKEFSVVYYTDCRCDAVIANAVRKQVEKCINGNEIINVSLAPIDWGHQNIVLNEQRSVLTMFKQVLAGVEAATSPYVFLVEHDVLYHPSHFDFTPPKDDIFYYDENRWFVDYETGRALFYHACSTSLLVANRELLVEHYRKRVERVEKEGFTLRLGYEPGNHPFPRGVDFYKRSTYFAECPSLDIRHKKNLTPTRWSQDQFRNKRNLYAWTEADEVPCWGVVKDQFKEMIGSI